MASVRYPTPCLLLLLWPGSNRDPPTPRVRSDIRPSGRTSGRTYGFREGGIGGVDSWLDSFLFSIDRPFSDHRFKLRSHNSNPATLLIVVIRFLASGAVLQSPLPCLNSWKRAKARFRGT